jgi:hypothetical protein
MKYQNKKKDEKEMRIMRGLMPYCGRVVNGELREKTLRMRLSRSSIGFPAADSRS